MNLVAILHDRARTTPDAIAIRDVVDGTDRAITYRELSRRVAAGAAFLEREGLKPGDTVLLVHPIRIELYEVLLAVFHAGMTAMLVDPSADRAFIEACCRRRVPDAYFGSPKAHLLRLAIPALRKVRRAVHCGGWVPFSRAWSTSGEPAPPAEVPGDAPALLTFTSGSTGAPKAAVRTHQFLRAQYRSLSRALELTDGDVDLVTLPVFVLANLAAGVTSVIADTDLRVPGQADAGRIRSQCARLEVTRCTASPAFFEALLAHPEGPPSFQVVHTGGGPVFLDLLDRLQHALPEARVMALYGSTEAEPIADQPTAILTTEDRTRASGGGGLPAGLPVEDVDLLILPALGDLYVDVVTKAD